MDYVYIGTQLYVTNSHGNASRRSVQVKRLPSVLKFTKVQDRRGEKITNMGDTKIWEYNIYLCNLCHVIFIYIYTKLFVSNLYTFEHPNVGPQIMNRSKTFRRGFVWWYFISGEMAIQLCGWVNFFYGPGKHMFFCGHEHRVPPNPLIYHRFPNF